MESRLLEQALAAYRKSIALDASPAAYTNLGNAYQKLGETEKAVDAWRRALSVDPSNERASRYLERFTGGVDAGEDGSED